MSTNELIEMVRNYVSTGRKGTSAYLGWASGDPVVLDYLHGHLGESWREDHPLDGALVCQVLWESIEENDKERVVWSDGPEDLYQDLVVGLIEPDDWQWRFLLEAAGAYSDADWSEEDELDEVQPDDEHYYSVGANWLASNPGRRAGYVDEYREEYGGAGDVLSDIFGGMYLEKREVYSNLRSAVESFLEDLVDEDE